MASKDTDNTLIVFPNLLSKVDESTVLLCTTFVLLYILLTKWIHLLWEKKFRVNSSSSSQQQVETPPEPGKKGNDAGHGNRFQSKLLILYAVRAIQLKYEFYLGTELSAGEKFDDLIFHYKEGNDVTFRQQYLQAKHRLNENKTITADNLLDADNGDFGLLKYFQSYVKIISKGNDVEHFIICTNVGFNHKDFRSNGITINLMKQETWPKFLDCKNVKNEQNCYKFQVHGKCKNILTGNILQCIQNCTGEGMKCLFQNCTEVVNGKQFSDHTADEMKIFFSNPQNQKQFNKLVEVVLNDFLEKLVFAVKMPNEDALDDILTKEVGKYFKLSDADLQSAYVMNKMVNWFKKQENLWLTADAAEKFLKNEAVELMKINYRTSLSIDYQHQTLKLGVLKFEDEVVRQLTLILQKFWVSQDKIKRIKSETPKLTAVKVISAIQEMTQFPNDDDYLVFSSKKLKENVNELEESKRAEKCHHLFVIVDEEAENPQENDTSYQNSIPPDINKKIIVISKNVSPGDLADSITFGNFHEDTKNKIRNIQVVFQGIDKTVRDLIKESQENELDSKFIENLLYTENNETNSVPSFNYGFNPSLYIQRKMKFPLEDQLLNKLAEVMDKNDSKETDRSEKENKKGENEMKSRNVKEEIRIDSNGKIHWLIDDDKRIKKIREKLKILLEQIDSKDRLLLNEIHSNNNRIIITGVAGTGKSTILSKYYEEIKEANPDKLVIKISLMKYSKALMNEKSINDEFLINKVMDQNSFAQQLLKHRLKTGDRIVLMLDGFDEIDSECQDEVVKLVKNLNESIPLYITTRPHLADKLQFELSQLAYSLDKFTEEDQINYLTSIWEDHFKKVSLNYNEEIIKKFAKDLIKRVSKTLKDKEKEFIGIPLQCKILAECFKSKIQEKIIREPNTDLSHLIGDQQFDLVHLYESLIDEKRRVFRQEKIKENSRKDHIVNNSIEYTIYKTERHLRKLAVQLIVNKQKDVNILIPAGFKSKSEKKMEEIQLNEFGIRFGLLDNKVENGIQFLHRTFAEYLVADYIFNGFLLDEEKHNKLLDNKFVRKWIIEEMLVNNNYEGVRVFFDSMLKEILNNKEWKNKIQNNNLPDRLQQFATLLRPEEDKIWSFDRAFEEINSNISLLIFDCLDVTFIKTPSEIPSAIYHSLQTVFCQRSDVFDRLLNYFDNAVNDDLSQFTKGLIHELKYEKQQIENKKLERFLVFVGRHVKNDWDFQALTIFFIGSKMEEQTKKQFFKILASKYLEDFEMTRLMKDAIEKSFKVYDCQIGEIENVLKILLEQKKVAELERIEVVGQLSRFLLLRLSETLKKEENAKFRLLLEETGMTGLHWAAFKGDLSLIEKETGCSLENPENCSEEEKKSVLQFMTNEKDLVPPFYLAAAYGRDDICQKIFRFFDPKKEISDTKGFLHRSLKDAIIYENVVMIQIILKHVKEIEGQNALVKLLQSSFFYCGSKLVVETIIDIFMQETENGCRDLNDLVFSHWSFLHVLEHVERDVLQKMIAAAGGFDIWIKRLIDTHLDVAFGVLSSDGFLDKLNQENQISQLIDILITRSTLDDNQPSEPSTSYWSDFVLKTSESWRRRMREFIPAISKCASEEDLKRLLLYRDDNDVLILLQYFIIEGRGEFNFILSLLPENLRKEIESEEEKRKLIDHFFSTPTFLESLFLGFRQLNAIEYYLENGNEKQLVKFSQVVKVHQLEEALRWEEKRGKEIADLLKEKLDSQIVIKYNEIIEKYSS